MNKIGVPAIDRIANIINGVQNTKQAIIETANFDEILNKEIKKYKQKGKIEKKQTQEEFIFDPNEVEPLVYRNNHDER